MTERPEETDSSRSLISTWLATLALALATTFSAYLRLGAFNLVVNIAIALAKTALVLLIFMRLRRGKPQTEPFFALAGFFWLGLLVALILADYLTRVDIKAPW